MMLLRKMNLTKRFRDPTIAITIEFTLIKNSLNRTETILNKPEKKDIPAEINLIFSPTSVATSISCKFYYCFTVMRWVMKHDLRPRFSHRRIESSELARRSEKIYSVTRFLTSFPQSFLLCLLSLQRE